MHQHIGTHARPRVLAVGCIEKRGLVKEAAAQFCAAALFVDSKLCCFRVRLQQCIVLSHA